MTGSFSAPQLDRLAAAVRSSTGLVFPRNRRALLQRAAVDAMREAGVADRDHFARLVWSDERQRSRLAALTTVGETYLFRYGEQLDELRRQVLEPLVAERRRETKPRLRVWSAGCSTGEETYTLAILLAETVGDLARWDIRVVGTDLHGDALRRAREGTYGRWSLRGSWAEHRRWLTPAGDGVRVAQEIRSMVTFEQHNLATLPRLPVALRGGPIDLIVCRNVMIYLDRAVIARIIDGFHGLLGNGGCLVVAPVETSIPGLRRRFDALPSTAGTIYRRPHRGPATPSPAPAPTKRVPVVAARPMARVGTRPPPAVVRAQPPSEEALFTGARSLADSGRLAEARDRCLELLRRFPVSIDGHLLLASIAEAQDDVDGASASLRRTLYLDPGNPSAQFRLGLLEWRRGGTKRAAARLQRAVQLVEGFSEDEVLDDVHLLSAARVRSVVGALLG